jgi:flagellar L-ring protein precursor FlgH
MRLLYLSPPALFLLLVSGCSASRPVKELKAPEQVRVLPKPPTIRDGSLWQEDAIASSSLTSDLKARAKGDIVRILIVEKVDASRKRNTETSKTQDTSASVTDVTMPGVGHLLGAAATAAASKAAVPATDTTKGRAAVVGKRDFNVALGSTRTSNGGGTISDTGAVQAEMSAQVAEVLPNGNLFLIGTKEVTVSGETQLITLTGLARVQDVTPENTISSTYLAEARISISGSGPLNDAQRRTLVSRVFDWVNLF